MTTQDPTSNDKKSDSEAAEDLGKNPAVFLAVTAALAFWELFRVLVYIPLRYMFLMPLQLLLTKVGLVADPPSEVFARLEAANQRERVSADALAAALKGLNKAHPEAVVQFVETRCLKTEQSPFSGAASPPSAASSKFAVNAGVVREYLAALTKSGQLGEYGEGVEGPVTPGKSHRSLQLLLQELRQALQQEGVALEPGAAVGRPLHVYVQGGSGNLLGQQPRSGLWTSLLSFLWFGAIVAALTFLWGLGATVVRKYTAGGATGGLPQPGNGAATAVPGGNSIFSPKEYSKENVPEHSRKTFRDVKGCDEAKAELQEIVEYLKNPDKFTRLGGKLPKGVLLTGPPGTGKTLLAKAVAGEAGVPFFFKAGSEFDEMFVGVGSRRVRSLFAAAKKKAPCIIFIDEIDAVGGKRTNWEASGGSRKTLNQLLTEMDGFEENSGVVVMGATNLPDTLDSALTRPGRFDRQVVVELPDVRGRKEILDYYLEGKPVAADVDAEVVARRTPGFSGAQLSNLVNEAALLAARYDQDAINTHLLDEARDKLLMGVPRSLTQSEEARRLTAYHEGGHALVALYTQGAMPIHKATIMPRGHALGMVSQVPDKDEYSTTKQQMLARMDVCMGGKAAEELIFGADHVTSGATSDLRSATRLARHMVEDCGMSELVGPMAVDSELKSSDIRQAVDGEVSLLLKNSYQRVVSLLREKELELHTLAAALLERETLTQAEIKELLCPSSVLGQGTAPAGASASNSAPLPLPQQPLPLGDAAAAAAAATAPESAVVAASPSTALVERGRRAVGGVSSSSSVGDGSAGPASEVGLPTGSGGRGS